MSRFFSAALVAIFVLVLSAGSTQAQTSSQTISLKTGFNFISFTVAPSETPEQLKARVTEIEDIYLYSAAAGSFLSVSEGSLASISAGKGYIIKATANASVAVSGAAVTAVSDISLKTGFNLVGISQSVSTASFSSLMKSFGIIKGIYKWSPAAGSFIQVVADDGGTPQLLDGADPQFKAGESYFINVHDNTTLSFSGGALSFTGGTAPAIVAKLIISGAAPSLGAPAYDGRNFMIAYGEKYEMGVYDSATMTEISGSAITVTGTSYSAAVPAGASNITALVVIKDKTSGTIVYSALAGRLPTAADMNAAAVTRVNVTGVDLTGESTAIAAIVKDKGIPVPSIQVTSSVTTMTASIKSTVEGAVTPATVAAVKNAIEAVHTVLKDTGVSESVRASILAVLDGDLKGVLNAFIAAVKNASQTIVSAGASTTITVGGLAISDSSTAETVTGAVSGVVAVTVSTVTDPADISVANGTALSTVAFPAAVSVTMSDGTTASKNVVWSPVSVPPYSAATAGTYVFSGAVDGASIAAKVSVIVGSAAPATQMGYALVQKWASRGTDNGTVYDSYAVDCGVTGTPVKAAPLKAPVRAAAAAELWEGTAVQPSGYTTSYSAVLNWNAEHTSASGTIVVTHPDRSQRTGAGTATQNGSSVVVGIVISGSNSALSFNGTVNSTNTSVSGTFSETSQTGVKTSEGTFQGSISAATKTVKTPDGKVLYMSANKNTAGSYIQKYSYGDPASTTVAFTSHIIGPSPSAVELPYMASTETKSGSETGTYQFNVDGNTVSLNDSASFLTPVAVTSPAENAEFDPSKPLTITWNSLGSGYKYFIEAVGMATDGNVTTVWTSIDISNMSYRSPETVRQFVEGGTSANTLQIPAGVFQDGQGVQVMVCAFNSTSFSYSDAAPYGTMTFSGSIFSVNVKAKSVAAAASAGGLAVIGVKTDGDDGALSEPVRKVHFILVNYGSKTIPAGNHTVTAPNGQVYNFTQNSSKGCTVKNYSYGGLQISIQGPVIDPRTEPLSTVVPYVAGAEIAAGSETGLFKFNIGGTEVSVNNTQSYMPAMKITSHTQNSSFSVSEPVTVTWDPLGSDYVYCFTATKIPSNDDWSSIDTLWSSIDIRDSKFDDYATFQKFLDNCRPETFTTIPPGVFTAGCSVDLWVQAFKKNSLNFSEPSPYGQYQLHTTSVGVQVYAR